MAKYRKSQKVSTETMDSAMSIAKSIQKPHQTKEQTKLIAQGIQKGIVEYKKQQKSKARELDKLKKRITHQDQKQTDKIESEHPEQTLQYKTHPLPWILLVISWIIMLIYVLLSNEF